MGRGSWGMGGCGCECCLLVLLFGRWCQNQEKWKDILIACGVGSSLRMMSRSRGMLHSLLLTAGVNVLTTGEWQNEPDHDQDVEDERS